MEVTQGSHTGGEVEALAQGGGQGFFGFGVGFGELFEDGPEDAAGPLAGELGAPGSFCSERLVDGNDAGHFEAGELGVLLGLRSGRGVAGQDFGQDLELGLQELEAAIAAGARGLELAVDGDLLAELEALAEIAAVEPDALDGGLAEAGQAARDVDAGGGETEGQLEEGASACGEQVRAADVAEQRGHFAGLHFCDGLGAEAVFVTEGQVVEEVFDSVDLALCELLANALANSLDKLDGGGEGERH